MDLNFTYINKVLKYTLLSFLALNLCSIASAQVKFQTVINNPNTSLEDYLQVDYIIENAETAENFVAPQFTGFRVVQGPSRSETVTVINGAMSRSQTITYLLQPLAVGKQVVQGASVVINNKKMQSGPVTVNVAKHGQGQAAARPNSPFMPDMSDPREDVSEEYRLAPGEDAKSKIAKNLFIKLDVNKTSCYVGEPFIAAYKLYSKVKSESRITKRPSLNGFSVYDMEDPNNRTLSIEKLKGKTYNVHIIRRSQLLPIQAGSYVLDAMELQNNVEFLRTSSSSRRGSNAPMDRMMEDFFGRAQSGEPEVYNVSIQSEPVTITVKPLPEENKPEGFNGAVGNFTVHAALQKKIIAAGDVAELEFTIDGSGNLPMINAPRIDLPAGMETFEPAVKEVVDKTIYPLRGSKIITYTFLTRNMGEYIIPPIKFSYFDPAAGAYKTISSDSLAITVEKSTRPANKTLTDGTVTASPAAPPVSSGWTDIINGNMLIAGAVILLLIVAVIYLLVSSRKKAGIPEPKPAKAPEVTDAAIPEPTPISLEGAVLALEHSKSKEFYSEVNKAIREAIYRKTGKAPSELTKFNLPFALKEKGVPTQAIQDLEAVMRECEMALYTPIHEVSDMQNVLEKASAVLRDFSL